MTVLTDHNSLQYWHAEHVATASGPSGRRARWHMILSRFNLAVEYLPGESNVVADALSRWVYRSDGGQSDVSKHGSAADAEFLRQSHVSVSPVTSSSSSHPQ